MSVRFSIKKLNKLLDFYQYYLQPLEEEVFLKSPKQGWSYSEIYDHIIYVNKLARIAIEQCLNKTAPIKTNKPNWRVRLIFLLGVFPPVRIKAPAGVVEKVAKISKEEALNQILKTRRKLQEVEPQFVKFDANYKIKHPRLGYLDAKDWLRFMVVHTNHHIKQIIRLEKNLSA